MAVQVLGPVQVTGPGGTAALSGVRQRALVGALAFNAGLLVPSARLVDALWGAEPPRTAFKTLHGHVARLRRVLHACGSPDLLVTSGSGYMLAAARDEVDALRFEDIVAAARADLTEDRPARAVQRLRDGLALWRGDPVQDGELFGWGEAEVHRLREVRLTALEDLCDAESRLGRHGLAVAEAERVLVSHPLRERMVELLMRACYRSGRPAEALGAYQRLRVRLADELGTDPSADLQRLHTAILRQDVSCVDVVRPEVLRPAQLPPRVGYFTGRGEQLRALDEALDGTADPRIAVVSGAGGMGKTAVVVQWAHTVRERFPDGQLFLDLRGHDDRLAMAPSAAIVYALRALGVPENRLPGDGEEQVSLLRSHLDGRRVLIVLDNAASADQVRPFVPASPTSALVVTSRRSMAALTTYHSVCDIPLGAMANEESLALLRDVVGAVRVDREPGDAATLARLCAGLPLALRIIAAKLAHRRELTLRELATDLSGTDKLGVLDIEGDSRGVRAVFASAYRTLSAPAAALFRRLGVQPELGFDPYLAAAVGGADQTEALAELVDAHLIADAGHGRYRFHDLIGVYAKECVDDGRGETVTRLLDWYLGIADAANRTQPSTYNRVTPKLTYPPARLPFTAGGALSYLDSERPNLLPVTRFAVDEGRDVAAWQLVYLLSGFYSTRGEWTDRIELCRLGLAAARRAGDAMAEGVMGGALGLAYIRMLRFTEALGYLYPAMERAQAAGDDLGAGRIRNNIGTAYARLRRFDEAVEIYQQALAAKLAAGDRIGVAVALNNIGLGRVRQGRPDEGLRDLTEALRLTRDVGDQRMEAMVLLGLGEARQARGDQEAALDAYRHALKLQRAVGDRHHQVDSLLRIGAVLLDAGEQGPSLGHVREALELGRELGDQHQISVCLTALARLHLYGAELDAAGECLRQALALRASVPDAYEEAAIHRALAELAHRRGQDAVADEHRQRAAWLYQRANAPAEAAELR